MQEMNEKRVASATLFILAAMLFASAMSDASTPPNREADGAVSGGRRFRRRRRRERAVGIRLHGDDGVVHGAQRRAMADRDDAGLRQLAIDRRVELALQLLVERGGRLVQEEPVRLAQKGARDGEPLVLAAREALEGDLAAEPDAVARNEVRKQISLRELEGVLRRAAEDAAAEFERLSGTWFLRLLGSP